MPGIIGPYSNWKPENDPYLKRHLPQKVEGAPDFLKGLLSGVAGLPSDVMQMLAQGSDAGPPHQGNPNAMRQRQMPALPIPLTSEHLGKIMGADTSSSGFMAGQIGAPDPKDLMKILAGNKLAMTLFHGGPHKFDKFDLEKIGTGEGAQAYGHGLYFAQNEGVAKSYTNAGGSGVKINGNPLSNRKRFQNLPDDIKPEVEEIFRMYNGHHNGDLEKIKSSIFGDAAAGVPGAKEAHMIIRDAKSFDMSGHLYEVDIPDDVTAKMLDWDAPLSDEARKELSKLPGADSAAVKAALDHPSTTGGGFYGSYAASLNSTNGREASEALKSLGIPGIRYLDAGSRGPRPQYRGDTAYLAAAKNFKSSGYSAEDAISGMKDAYKDRPAKELQAAIDEVYDIQPKQSRNIVLFDTDTIREVKRDGERVYENKLGLKK